ncbi:DNA helicase, partial [Tanacetum coccineum]
MRTKRKLILKSNISSSAGSGQHNVVGQSGYNNVCNVYSGVPLKKQCVRQLSLVPCRVPESGVGLEVSRLPDVALSVPRNRRCIRQLNSASCRVQGSSTSKIPVGKFLSLIVVIAFRIGELCHRAHHVADANAFPNTSSGPQEQNTCSRTRRESTIRKNSLCGQSRVSGPPSEYKHIGNCTHTCQHCGALFWYEGRLKSSMPRGPHPHYNCCCKGGRVALCTYQIYLEYMKLLLEDRHFLENIRAYNQMFSMTSLGAQVDESINNGRGPYVFKISGQLYHWIGSLCPAEGEPPRFLQLYIYDTDNDIDNRMTHFGGGSSALRRDIVEGLIELLDAHNALVQLFRTAREKLQDMHIPNFKVRLYNIIGAREYELPTRDMLGVIVYEPGLETDMDYDIIIEERSGYPQRVNKLHPSYMSLQFPLLFIYGQDGYSKELRMVSPTGSSSEQKRVSMLAYYSYYLHDRANQYNYLSRTRRLFQQYVVTAFCAIEQNRIDYVREHQNDIMNEYLSGIYDAINRGDIDGSDCGSKLITAIFHRVDVVDRVFEMKIHQLINFLRDAQPLERLQQKRGLPHCHTLLWIDESARVRKEEDIDVYISAELPPEDID